MSKYNEEVRLQNLKEFVDEYANEEELTSVDGVRATIDIIEEQLNNYKKLLNSNPSEALECLEKVKYYEVENHIKEGWNIILYEEMQEELDTIKQALIQTEQDKKKAICWDIVVKKNVDVSLIKKYDFVEDYNSAVWIAGRHKLVKEEFDLLKEVLDNE